MDERNLETSDKSLYMQDLEERARLQGITADEVREKDKHLLSHARPTPECLRPEEVMEGATDIGRLSHRSWTHFQNCEFCQGLVAFAKPDAGRAKRMAAQLAALPQEGEVETVPVSPRIIRWTDAVIGGVDRVFSAVWQASPILAAGLLVVYLGSPDWLRTSTPSWIWTNGQLERSAFRVLDQGNTVKADTLAGELIKRDPDNLNGYLLRSQALSKEGKTDLAGKEAAAGLHKVLGQMKPEDRAMVLRQVFAMQPQDDRRQLLQTLTQFSGNKDSAR